MRPKEKLYDVIIVGSGATGIWAARRLARKGLKVAVVEAGDLLNDEAQTGAHDSSLFLPLQAAPYTHPSDRPFHWFRIRGLGGRMNAWARACLRMSDLDFRAAELDGEGACWPITHSDLSPYYEQAEAALRVQGVRENWMQIPDGRFQRSPANAAQRAFKRHIEQSLPEFKVTPQRFSQKENFRMLLWPGIQRKLITPYLNHVVAHVSLAKGGTKATGVVVIDQKTMRKSELRAKAVALCASTIETASLLLRSKCAQHPRGLGNFSGELGRNLMEHTTVDCAGIIPLSQKTEAFYSYFPRIQNLGKPDRNYLRGFGIQFFIQPCEALLGPGSTCVFTDQSPGKHRAHFVMRSFGEVLPKSYNRVTLNPCAKDSLGLPVPHIDFRYSENERKIIHDQRRTLEKIAAVAKFQIVTGPQARKPGFSIHEVGTARMGSDPATSVVNRFNQVWGIPNLYVLDGSCFVSSGVQNPTLTMMAIAGRASDHLAKALKEDRFSLT